MKKVIVGIIFALALTGCGASSEADLKKAISNTASLTNYTMETTTTLGTGEIVITHKYDGDKTYTQGFLTEHYTVKIDGDFYLIQQNASDDTWSAVKIIGGLDEENGAGFDFGELENNAIFDYENFNLTEGYYALKEATEDYVDFKLKIRNGYIVEIGFSVEIGNSQSSFEVKLSKINSTEITLPAYTIVS